MRKLLLMTLRGILLLTLVTTYAFAQTGSIKGTVIDDGTSEPVVGASVLLKGTSTGVVTDANGAFQLEGVASGSQTVVISYIGYPSTELAVRVPSGGTAELGSVKLISQAIGLDEVSIIASVAIDRKTPVAVSTVKGATIEAKIGNQEFPEILRSTPSVYVTKQGGGFGDARVNIRGFDTRNIAIMINGIPVNDMENGWVYWSNWAGLSDVTNSMQVQRGLGASKLAVSSVGGSINIVTNAAEMKKGGNVQLSYGNNNYMKFGATYSTGLNAKGWAFTVQGTHTRGEGYVDGTEFQAYSYFASVAKKINANHSLLLTAVGAPQWHNQRSFASTVIDYKLNGGDRYYKYNSSWGKLDGEEFTMAKNFYHKPKVFLNHFWTISDKTELATSAYASYGRGGGTGDAGRINGQSVFSNDFKDAYGIIRFDDIKTWNQGGAVANGSRFTPQNTPYATGPFAGQYVGQATGNGIIRRSSMNEHNWYGILSNLTHHFNEDFTFSGGIDARYYKGLHYRRVEDLLGLAAYRDVTNVNDPDRFISDEGRADGNEIAYNNDGLSNWIGLFGQLEYSHNNLSVFASGSYSNQGFKRVDYFLYTPAATNPPQETEWQNFGGGTVKIGANYNINAYHNVFVNGGYFSQQPLFNAVFVNNTNVVSPTVENQDITSIEAGYGFRSARFNANVNLYNTVWGNRQFSRTYTDANGTGSALFTDVAQLHRGIEFDFRYSPISTLSINGSASFGNWRYTDDFSGNRYDADNNYIDTKMIYAKDAKVGDAAQTTISLGAEYDILRNLSVYASYYYADNLYAAFNVASGGAFDNAPAPGEGANQAWQLPSYSLVDGGVSYRFKVGGTNLTWRFNMNNILDEIYISESTTNILYDANNAVDAANGSVGTNGSKRNQVYYGMGRTWNTSLKISF